MIATKTTNGSGPANGAADIVLEIKNLKTHFHTEDGVVKAVDGVDFFVKRGEVLGLVGESGCGKSVTCFSILRLVGSPGKILDGEVIFEGRDLLKLAERDMVKVRGDRIAMIFQQPQSSLNPVFKVGDQIAESLTTHRGLSYKAAWERAVELMVLVGIPDAGRRAHAYPHELSGGMAQRVMIAMALACEPELLIADEPTTALDVTVQAQILRLLAELQKDLGLGILLITHDLGIVARVADRVSVMYAGKVVESAPTAELFRAPRHPYTRGLLSCVPVPGKVKRDEPLGSIPGVVPRIPPGFIGCAFRDRCGFAEAACAADIPRRNVGPAHEALCILPEGARA